MSLTATISLNLSQQVVGKNVRAFVTVSNSNAIATTVNYIQPKAYQTGNPQPTDKTSYLVNAVPVNQYPPVPAGGSTTFPFDIVFNTGSLTLDGDIQGTYSVTCLLQGSDGSLVTPIPATVSIIGNNQYA